MMNLDNHNLRKEKKIKLMKSSFFNEISTKEKLINFIRESHILSMNENCFKAERKFADFQEVKYSVLFNSGSSANLALIQSLLNKDLLKKGQKVAFSALTWATNVMPLIQLGLKPIPIDIEYDTLNVSSFKLKDTLFKHPDIRVFFLTNVLGFCDDIDNIQKVCNENNIILIEDNCESLGTVYKKKKLGNFGLASTSSFFVGHHLSTIEGGIITTNDKELFSILKMVRSHGWDRNICSSHAMKFREKYDIDDFYSRYTFYDLAYNIRPTEITGFLLLEQLKNVKEIIEIRERNFWEFHNATISNPKIIKLKINNIEIVSNFAFPLIFKTNTDFKNYLQLFKDSNIEIRPIVAGNIVRQPFFRKYSNEKYSLPNCDKVHSNGFYFPNNPELTENEISRIIKILKDK